MFNLGQPHLHLLVNHLPIEGLVIVILLAVYGLIRKSPILHQTNLILLIVIAVSTFIADSTGGGAARAMRGYPGFDSNAVREHAQAADFAKMGAAVLGVLALIVLIWAKTKKREIGQGIAVVFLLLSLFVLSIMSRVAYLGGEIRHTEIRENALPGSVNAAPQDTTHKLP